MTRTRLDANAQIRSVTVQMKCGVTRTGGPWSGEVGTSPGTQRSLRHPQNRLIRRKMSRECEGIFLARERRDNKDSSPKCTHEGFCTSEGLHAFAHVTLFEGDPHVHAGASCSRRNGRLLCLTKRGGTGARGSHPLTPASRTIRRRRLNRAHVERSFANHQVWNCLAFLIFSLHEVSRQRRGWCNVV